jgi:PDDEXK-like uncharacterized protein DUF3799
MQPPIAPPSAPGVKKPGMYQLPLDQYVRDPAPAPSLSASLAHLMLSRSPRHCWQAHPRLNTGWQADHNDAAEVGTIAHALLLENDRSRVVIVNEKDWRKKEAQEQRLRARGEGKLPILAASFARIEAMVEAARARLAASEELDLSTLTLVERTFIWEEHGLWLRARPDWISEDRRILVDYKTAENAEPDTWARGPLFRYGLDLQAALALRGAAEVAKPKDGAHAVFVFAVQETEPPYALSLISLSPAYQHFAERRLATAIARFRYCLENSAWPPYSSHIAYVEPPGWATLQWEERQIVDDGRPIAEQML